MCQTMFSKILDFKQFLEYDFLFAFFKNSTPKRYDYIDFDDVHWGKADSEGCGQKIRFVDFIRQTNNSDLNKKYNYLHLCTCIEKNNGKINLDNVIPDIDENKYSNFCDQSKRYSFQFLKVLITFRIVTGVRFIFKNNALGLQIEQGKLGPFGSINQSSIEWKTPDWKFTTNTKIHEIGYGNNEMYLDDLMNLEGLALIGIKFKSSKHPEDGKVGVKLAILTMPFNFTTGELSKGKYSWESSDDYER